MKKKLNLIIDRFEERLVVLIDKEGYEINFLEKHLPAGLKEGDVIKLEFFLDKKETRTREKEIRQLIDKLKKRNL